jgi:hypothetical protein
MENRRENMYFYNLSTGEYSDYNFTFIMHEKKFTRLEFITMYNEIVTGIEECDYDSDVAEIMCDKYGFKLVKEELEINCGYGRFTPITNKEDLEGEHTFIEVSGEY